ncbi:3-oxoadipate enol-lactonase [Aurantimonas aggregata]|uniref:3-oxoadipate enol-lactonase n=1 Tax=Aurantimonas aggregata TaxID=2047720 RepID=A0A6L9ME18_9HYPH|nr:3-oxoadipate enol-lactonase [Aurantimonas aggregata]NDV85822.1 3-oxoadipate enol-lactonase [Aurantimonas aggregata]
MAFQRVNGIVLHYSLERRGPGPTLVFANSLGTDFRIWDPLLAELGDQFTVLRYDKRGHGLSEATPPPYAMDDHVADLNALLDHLDIHDPLVVGLSIGGMIAQGLAARHPKLARGLVLMDTAHRIGTDELWNQRIAAVEAEGIAAIAEGILARWFTPAYRRPENPDFVGYANMLLRTPREGYLGSSAALRDTDYTADVAGLDLPVLCIVGDQDGSTPPDLVRSTAALIRGAEFVVVENAGHLPCIEQPAVTAKLIERFAAQIFGTAARP